MPRISNWTCRAPAVLALAALLCGCEGPAPGEPAVATAPAAATENPEDTEQKLVGTWLREFNENGIASRRILLLQPDGVFHESVRIVDASGGVTEQTHEGTWIYDGTNLKRKYTLMNGKSPSRLNLPFATFAIHFETRNEFVGVDHIHGNRIRYQRVGSDTKP
jgi:hypothetical protein